MAGAHGGQRRGAGRKAGLRWPSAATGPGSMREAARVKIVQLVTGTNDPLDFVVSLVNDTDLAPEMRLEAARVALPYIHPRLSAIATASTKIESRSSADVLQTLLDRAARITAAPAITIDGDAVATPERAPR